MLRSIVLAALVAVSLSVVSAQAQDANARWAEPYVRQLSTYAVALNDVANNRVFPLPVWPINQLSLVVTLQVQATVWAEKTKNLVKAYAWSVPTDSAVKAQLIDIYTAGDTVRNTLVQFTLVDTRIVNYWNGYAPLMRVLRERFRDLPLSKDMPNPRAANFNKLYSVAQ